MHRGAENLHIHLSKNCWPIVSAVLSVMAASSTHLVKASVITMMYLFPFSDVLRGPIKSMWTLLFGPLGIGMECRGSGGGSGDFVSWQVSQFLIVLSTSLVIPGHQYANWILLVVLSFPPCPASNVKWAASTIACLIFFGGQFTCRVRPLNSSFFIKIPLLVMKQPSARFRVFCGCLFCC